MAKYSEGDFIKGLSGSIYRVNAVGDNTYYVTRVWSDGSGSIDGKNFEFPHDHAEGYMFSLLSTSREREDTHDRSWTITPGMVLKRKDSSNGVFIVIKTEGVMVEDRQQTPIPIMVPGVNLVYIRFPERMKFSDVNSWYRRVQWPQRDVYRELVPSEDEHSVKGGWELDEG